MTFWEWRLADVEQGVVAGDQAADGIVAHHVGAAHVVGAGDDFGDGVAERVEDEDFAAVGLERQLHGPAAYVEEGFEAIGLAGRGGAVRDAGWRRARAMAMTWWPAEQAAKPWRSRAG